MQNLVKFFKGLSGRIIIGMLLGVAVGLFIQAYKADYTVLETLPTYLDMLGKMFLNLMNMCIPFLIFGSIVMSVSSLDLKEFGTVGGRTLLLFLITTACAAFFAVIISSMLPFAQDPLAAAQAIANGDHSIAHKGAKDIILNFFPSNVFVAFSQPIVLQVIVFGCLFGLCINMLKDTVPGVSTLLEVTLAFRAVIMKIITMVMYIAPIGIFGILSYTIATKGLETLISLGQVLIYITLINIAFLVLYFIYISVRYGLSLGMLIKKSANVIIFAVTTTSTAMCLPVAMQDAKYLGVKEKLSHFILPLGNSLNTNGGPITNVVIVVAAMSLSGTPMDMMFYFLLAIYATIAAFGNPGVIGGALVSLAVVCDLSGVPLDVAVIFFGVDYFLGITRVPCNIMGSIFCSIMMAKKRGEFDKEVFNTPLDVLMAQTERK
ncbi:Na+/H+-dicarboxylate symporter [Orbus hercynius]|uniref:Na+/H+-dicarboxylate symporter n=1 Tax=Orbus hercynius TaxID=593135 RepID=A0A495RIV6_9GAMM|nr:dicarboxylate/amino acid:cation symporter [Orbus hercynius]RKS87463.1 Na+/H+-dicarboxylate symporter [Orbus hercynius]